MSTPKHDVSRRQHRALLRHVAAKVAKAMEDGIDGCRHGRLSAADEVLLLLDDIAKARSMDVLKERGQRLAEELHFGGWWNTEFGNLCYELKEAVFRPWKL